MSKNEISVKISQSSDNKLRKEFRRLQQKYRRGLMTVEELTAAETDLRRQKARPGRIRNLVPAQGPQSVRVPMDRMTELALAYLQQLDPAELNLDRRLEKAEIFRAAVCRWAAHSGWYNRRIVTSSHIPSYSTGTISRPNKAAQSFVSSQDSQTLRSFHTEKTIK